MLINTNHPGHVTLEQEVIAQLQASGFYTSASTYHETMPPELVQVLQRRFSITALYLRSRADRCAVHKIQPVEFEWEVKSHANPRYDDLTLEFLPLITNAERQRLYGVKCLYIFRVNKIEGGFWSWPLPDIRELRYSPRQEWQEHRGLILHLASFYGIHKVIEKAVSGSGDPFVVIDESVIRKMHRWEVLVDQLLTQPA
jgi:hypothetical protein